jgi:hypothetical protein
MNDQAIWGLLLLLYVAPFWLWQFSEFNKIEARKKIYAGRLDEILQKKRFDNFGLLWCIGLSRFLRHGSWMANSLPSVAGRCAIKPRSAG